MKKILIILTALVVSSIITTPVYSAVYCNRKVRIVGELVIVNSAWGKGSLSPSDFTNCQQNLSPNPKTRFWWDWPDSGTRKGRVKAFNHMSLGINPDTQQYIGSKLPKRLKSLPSPFKIDVRTSKSGVRNGKWNYSINMRAYIGTSSNPNDQRAEIHVYENYSGTAPTTNRIGTMSVDGSLYYMRKVTNSKGQPYFQAWRKVKRNGGVINLKAHLNYFRNNSTLNGNWYLGYIRPGFEVISGKADCTISKFTTIGF